jgi:hypothetical protein
MRILRLTMVHNEADVLPYNLDHYADAGFETAALLDADSSDGSREICERALEDGKLVELEEVETDAHRIDRLLGGLQALADKHRPDALLIAAPDEFFEVADGSELRPAIEQDLDAGHNLLKFWNMEFHLTREDDGSEPDPRRRMRHYSLWDLTMYRGFPYVEGIDLVKARSHRPVFPPGTRKSRSERRYVSRHYPLRSEEQALRKIGRMRPTPETPAATTHYLRFSGDADELYVDPRHLHRYEDDHEWEFDQPFLPVRLRDTTRALARSESERRRLQERVAELEDGPAEP